MSVDILGDDVGMSPVLELATVVPFIDGEEGAVLARDWAFDLDV